MPQLSVVIITFNEERNIERCLASIQGLADDIIVVDSFSTDKTAEICNKHKVNFIQQKWDGYSNTKNFANAQAKFDWILSLDADEALSPELKKSIFEIKNLPDLQTCSFNRLTNYCGSWIKHCSWYPDVKIRLFDKRITKWSGAIHEELLIPTEKPIIHLKGDCLHYSYYTIEEHYAQADKFSSLAAKDLYLKNKNANGLQIIFRTVAKFIRNYIIKLGFLDGSKGFVVCRIAAYETYQKYSKLRNLNNFPQK